MINVFVNKCFVSLVFKAFVVVIGDIFSMIPRHVYLFPATVYCSTKIMGLFQLVFLEEREIQMPH